MDAVASLEFETRSLSPSSSLRRRSGDHSISSPEFEFWKVRNSSFPPPNLLSADQLFSGGILLPLDFLPTHQKHHALGHANPESNSCEPPISEISVSESGPPEPQPDPGPGPDSMSSSAASITAEAASCGGLTASKRWTDIFKKSDKKSCSEEKEKGKENRKEKKRNRKNGGGGSGSGSSNPAELNINIWPFSRSRSAGNNSSRPKSAAAATRNVSSAPCSRSNSSGETKSRKTWPSSPGRAGVHLGRNSPVWQVRRAGSGGRSRTTTATCSSSNAGTKKPEDSISTKKETSDSRRNKLGKGVASSGADAGGAGDKGRGLSINVPMCIGYRHHLSCQSDEASAIGQKSEAGGGVGGSRNVGNGGGNLFNIRSLFAKKVVY